MEFNDPVVSGTVLTREAIRSPNYVANSSGWSVNVDGSAEFNDVTARGDVEIGPPSPAPRTAITPNIPASLVAHSTDFTWKAGIFQWYNGTDYQFECVGFYNIPDPGASSVWAKGTYDTVNGVIFNWFELGPGAGGGSPVMLMGSNVYNSVATEWWFRNAGIWFQDTTTVKGPTGFEYANGTVGLGMRTSGFTATSGGVTPSTEVAIPAASWDVEASAVFLPNHVYRFVWSGQLAVSGVIGLAGGTVRVRQGSASTSGTEVARTYVAASTNTWEPTARGEGLAFYAGSSPATYTFSLTIQKNSGAGGTNLLIDSDAFSPVTLEIKDEGLQAESRFNMVTAFFT